MKMKSIVKSVPIEYYESIKAILEQKHKGIKIEIISADNENYKIGITGEEHTFDYFFNKDFNDIIKYFKQNVDELTSHLPSSYIVTIKNEDFEKEIASIHADGGTIEIISKNEQEYVICVSYQLTEKDLGMFF